MTYQLLVSTMHQKDFSLLDRMQIDSDAIIINQADRVAYDCVTYKGHKVEMYTFAERGVGLSRNSALMRATADIVQFADDDMVMAPGYREKVLKEFSSHPKADVLLFFVDGFNKGKEPYMIKRFKRIGLIEARNYNTSRLAVRREFLAYHNLCFSLLFGGGARYSCGEDTLLLYDMLRCGLRLYSSPVKVADLLPSQSTWFTGYTE